MISSSAFLVASVALSQLFHGALVHKTPKARPLMAAFLQHLVSCSAEEVLPPFLQKHILPNTATITVFGYLQDTIKLSGWAQQVAWRHATSVCFFQFLRHSSAPQHVITSQVAASFCSPTSTYSRGSSSLGCYQERSRSSHTCWLLWKWEVCCTMHSDIWRWLSGRQTIRHTKAADTDHPSTALFSTRQPKTCS